MEGDVIEEISEPGEVSSTGLRIVEAPGVGGVKIENHDDSDFSNDSVIVDEDEVEGLIEALGGEA